MWVTHGRRSTKKRRAKPAVPFPAIFSPDTGEDYNKHRFMSRQHFFLKKWRLRVNICFSASETYKKEIYLNVDKSLQLFLCFQMRMWTNFANLVRLLPPEDKSHKWHLSHPIVYSCCCCFFFMVSSFLIPNLLLYVLVNTSAMHFLCLSFTVSSFEIKRRAPRIVSSIEHDTLRCCWKIFGRVTWISPKTHLKACIII